MSTNGFHSKDGYTVCLMFIQCYVTTWIQQCIYMYISYETCTDHQSCTVHFTYVNEELRSLYPASLKLHFYISITYHLYMDSSQERKKEHCLQRIDHI